MKSLNKFYIKESRTHKIKRKYLESAPVHVGKYAPVRDKIISFINEKGSCTVNEINEYLHNNGVSKDYCCSKWMKHNNKYVIYLQTINN